MCEAEDEPDDQVITCWCGAQGTYEELFDESGLEDGCNGTGSVNCFCGGDQCVCHFHGETECPGCKDCEWGEDEWDDDYDEED
jgi:hypothetical protein